MIRNTKRITSGIKENKYGLLFLALTALLFLAAIFLPGKALAAGNHVMNPDGVLSESEASKLQEQLDKVSSKHGVDVVVLIWKDPSAETSMRAADDYYDYNGYSENGILFMVGSDSRKWAISTRGTCIPAFTDAGQNYITSDLKEYLGDGNYYDAFKKFADYADDYLKQYEKGKPYDSGNLPKKPFKGIRDGIISILAGLGIGFGRASILKSETKTVKEAKSAAGYLVNTNITGGNEFLKHREFRRIERSTSSGSGGGSSTHTSSSGATHGGSEGSF